MPRTPQQNGRAERKHRHLIETARALKLHANLPTKFWGSCVVAATHLINMPVSSFNWMTPFERLYGRKPDHSELRVVGCLCYSLDTVAKDKFGPKGRRCILLG